MEVPGFFVSFQSNIGNQSLLLKGRLNLFHALKNNLYLSVTALDVYDNKPARGVAKNDLQLRSAVGLKF